MEVGEQRLLANEGQRVREVCLEPPDDGLVRVEAVELRGGCEERAGERLVLHAHSVSPPWGREGEVGTRDLTLFGSAISIKVCRGHMCRWFGSSKKVGSPPDSFGGPAGILSSRYSWGMYSCW